MDSKYRFDLDEPCCRCLNNQVSDIEEPCKWCEWNCGAEEKHGSHFLIIPTDKYAANVTEYINAVISGVI